jgi:WD40 repeat protein
VRVLKAADSEVLDLAFSPDGRAIAAGFEYLPVFLWNLESSASVPVRLTTDGAYTRGGLQFSADGRSLWWWDGETRWTYNRDTRLYAHQVFAIPGRNPGAVASNDGSRIISQHGMPNYCLIGWQSTQEGWRRQWTVSTADIAVESLTLSADGRKFALAVRSTLGERWMENELQVEVWDGATGGFLGKGDYAYGYAPVLLFSPEASQLVGINDMTLLVWSVLQLGQPHLVRNDSRKDFTAIAYHPSGHRLFATSNDATAHVFDTATWERVARFTWQIGKLKAIAVSPDGTLAAAGGENGDIVIWDVDL